MNEPAANVPSRVLALLDDAAAAAALLELSAQLARLVQRELSVVYVESAPSLAAATLPFAQVLAPSGEAWLPLRPQDVERGFRLQAARLREVAARVALRDAVQWSLRVMRGSLLQTAFALHDESDLLLLPGMTPPLRPDPARRARTPPRRPVLRVLDDGSDAARRAAQLAAQLARAVGGVLEIEHTTGTPAATPPRWAVTRAELLVLPRPAVDSALLALLRGPVLLVG